ncbi:hypothetical protein H7F33_16825 [Pedobacter sp. PAMC26386]|nr:hypothetical protein H7F33_16825 [Pedobacter sp. PAMC26386]
MKRFLLGLLIGIPILSFGQSNFQKGYVVTNVKDTLKGYIDYKERLQNPTSFTFRVNLGADAQNFTVNNALSWAIEGFEVYQRYEVNISMSRTEIDHLSVGPDNTTKKEVVFLKVLQAGQNVVLFSYTDGMKQRFYLLEKDGTVPYELIRQVYLDANDDNKMIAGVQYIRQLAQVSHKFSPERQIKKITTLKYSETDLIAVAAAINDQKVIKSTLTQIRFFAGAGLNISKASYTGSHFFAGPNAVNKTAYTPLFTGGFDFFANPAIGKVIYRAELSIANSKNEISRKSDYQYPSEAVHSFEQLNISLSPQVIYNIYNANRMKIFASGGIGLNFSNYKNNQLVVFNDFRKDSETTENAVELEKFYFTLPFTAGVVFNKKIEFSAGYAFSSPITNYGNFSIGVQRYRIGVNYLFGKL